MLLVAFRMDGIRHYKQFGLTIKLKVREEQIFFSPASLGIHSLVE
jgi:hypothetical protein